MIKDNVKPRVKAAKLRALEEYWRSKMHGDALPARRDLDPWEMRAVLPQVFMVTVTRNPMRFWFRLFGTGAAEEYGADVTGQYLDEIDLDQVQSGIIEHYKTATLEGRPVYSRCHYVKNDGKSLHYERVLLPLSSDGETVDMLLGGIVPIAADE
jgi:hypothetical protein